MSRLCHTYLACKTPGIPPKRNQRPTDDVEAAPKRKDKSDTYQCIRPSHRPTGAEAGSLCKLA